MLPQVHPNALRHKPVGWRKYQPVIFTAILIGFPLSNVLLFFCTQMFPLVRPNSPHAPLSLTLTPLGPPQRKPTKPGAGEGE